MAVEKVCVTWTPTSNILGKCWFKKNINSKFVLSPFFLTFEYDF